MSFGYIPQETGRSIGIRQWHALARTGAAPAVTIRLNGDSMRPLIRRRLDLVTIVPLTGALRVGDVVLFQDAAQRYVLHRVRRLRDGQVQTLGDNCLAPDPWIPEEWVLGQAVKLRRKNIVLRLDSLPWLSFGKAWMGLLPLRSIWRGCKARLARWKQIGKNWIKRRE